MVGIKEGGLKTAATNKKKYGEDFYKNIGARGGRNGHTGGFAADPERARWAGAKGGSKSRRGKSTIGYAATVRDNLDKVKFLIDSGWSLKEIARFLQVPPASLYVALRRENLK